MHGLTFKLLFSLENLKMMTMTMILILVEHLGIMVLLRKIQLINQVGGWTLKIVSQNLEFPYV